jgi:hypothetical protein
VMEMCANGISMHVLFWMSECIRIRAPSIAAALQGDTEKGYSLRFVSSVKDSAQTVSLLG